MKKRNLILVAALFVLAVLLLWYGLSTRGGKKDAVPATPEASTAMGTMEQTADYGYSESAVAAARKYLEENPAESYLLVRTSQSAYSPIPLNEENAFKITQADGSENTVHIGKNSFYMESSNCDNQNCVDEGEVTLENMNSRILFNMVLCLPHQLSLEMLTPDQAETALCEMYMQQEAYLAAMQEYLATLPENQENRETADEAGN